MSYYEQAKGINEDLKQLFGSINIEAFTPEQRERILNIILRFGRIAKFRCRSNSAYTNFSSECLKDLANVKWVEVEGKDYETLRADLVREESNKVIA